MNFLSPQIAKMANNPSKKSLIKRGVSCGIFQELGVDEVKEKPKASKWYYKK